MIYQLNKKNKKTNILSWREQDALSNNNIKIFKKKLQLLKLSYPKIKKKKEKKEELEWVIIIKP